MSYLFDLWLDRGGTFTDVVVWERASGRTWSGKVPSEGTSIPEAIRRLLGVPAGAEMPACDVRIGTTLVTNLVLEGKGEPAALLLDEGFEDLLRIGDQARDDLFDLRVAARRPPVARTVGLRGRRDAEGRPVVPLDEGHARRVLEDLRDEGVYSLGVALLHAGVEGADERAVEAIARSMGFRYVVCSHRLAPNAPLLERATTVALDARLTPVLRRWLDGLREALPDSRLRLGTSSGTLVDVDHAHAPFCLLSGPAAGAVAVRTWAHRAGAARLVGLDMGGTSTDVVRIEDRLPLRPSHEVAGHRIAAPAVDIHTVAAGGGSVCRIERGRLTVGPTSVGAVPGPLCYGRPEARELALTDVLLWLGWLVEDRLPWRPARGRVEQAVASLAERASLSPQALCEGFVEVALEHMARAVRRISVERGADPREHPLLVYGGAGGLLACQLGERLGSPEVWWPPRPGVLSAWGLAHAPLAARSERALVPMPLGAAALERAGRLLREAEAVARAELSSAAGGTSGRPTVRRTVTLRYAGTADAIEVAWGDETELRSRFEREHTRRYGFSRSSRELEVTGIVAVVELEPRPLSEPEPRRVDRTGKPGRCQLWWRGQRLEAQVVDREAVGLSGLLHGPAVVLDETATFFLAPGWTMRRGEGGLLRARGGERRVSGDVPDAGKRVADGVDPVLLEVYHHAFAAIAERMGAVLRRTAVSANVRERRDYSCALFDPQGRLVASAPHIPVHLGAMGETVRAVARAHPQMRPGDVFAVNDPAMGGTHLPDVTVVAPLRGPEGDHRGFVAARGHHADLGGVVPGSMPADSRRLEEEGILFRGERIVSAGRFLEEAVRAALAAGPWPARRPDDNVADLLAQVAACRAGADAFDELVARRGWPEVLAYMGRVQDDAAEAVHEVLRDLPEGWTGTFEDALDDGTPIVVRLHRPPDVARRGVALIVDFAGTGRQHPGNLNAPPAVSRAAVLYVLRALVARPMPLNEGCLRAVLIRLPEGSLLRPAPDAAVAGGNVETSQRLVDVLLGAFGRCAASQGTMNNLTIGASDFAHYETIGGGVGAAPGYHGASGVHSHMTNARITDPEVLEQRFPLRLWRFALRRGSGGAGRYRGGDGLVREIELLADATVSVLTQRRRRGPYGMAGGAPGAPGRNLLDGHPLPPVAVVRARAGSRIVIETPGGGGWGAPAAEGAP